MVELRPTRFSLESVLGSLPPLPNESIDVEAEIDEAVAEVAARCVRRISEQREPGGETLDDGGRRTG